MVVLVGLWMGVIVIEQSVESPEGLFALRPVGMVDDMQCSELGVVVFFTRVFVAFLPVDLFVVEGDECFGEIIGFGMWAMVEECDVCVVERVLVEDALAPEDTDDVCLVLEVGLCKFGRVHTSNFSGLDMW